MSLKIYRFRGATYQFEEGQEPAGAVLLPDDTGVGGKAAGKPANKARKPANKMAGARGKRA